jgi:hypothetical protein
MIMIFTANANASSEVKKELSLASKYNLTVVPVRAENIQPSEAFELEFATRQWIDLFADRDDALRRLTATVRRALGADPGASMGRDTSTRAGGGGTHSTPTGGTATVTTPQTRGSARGFFAVILLIAIGAAVWNWWPEITGRGRQQFSSNPVSGRTGIGSSGDATTTPPAPPLGPSRNGSTSDSGVSAALLARNWAGTYYYPDGRRAVYFTLQLQENGGTIAGTIDEDDSGTSFHSTVSGSISGQHVSFVKQYDGTNGRSNTVNYEGELNQDRTSLSGTWTTGGASGSFTASASH